MFSMVRRFIKTALAFLAVGLGLGGYLLVQREMRGSFPHPYLVSAHVHAVGIGFVMFLILGVALWLFPKPAKGDARYRPSRIAAAYWVLLAGTLARFAGEVARAWSTAPTLKFLVLSAGAMQIIGLGMYFHTMWSRIRPVGSQIREARGERF